MSFAFPRRLSPFWSKNETKTYCDVLQHFHTHFFMKKIFAQSLPIASFYLHNHHLFWFTPPLRRVRISPVPVGTVSECVLNSAVLTHHSASWSCVDLTIMMGNPRNSHIMFNEEGASRYCTLSCRNDKFMRNGVTEQESKINCSLKIGGSAWTELSLCWQCAYVDLPLLAVSSGL